MLPLPLLLVPAALQALAMLFDEGLCHRRRGLGRWERLGHPVDTLSVAVCYAWLVFTSPESHAAMPIYIALSIFSCLLITKDEFVHARECGPMESWLHAVLFVLHPIVFLAFGVLWKTGEGATLIEAQLALTIVFALYQFFYWSIVWQREPRRSAA